MAEQITFRTTLQFVRPLAKDIYKRSFIEKARSNGQILSLKELRDKVAPDAYAVAETEAWIAYLNPEYQVFEVAYEFIYPKIAELLTPEVQNSWFHSKEIFEEQINTYLVPREDEDEDEGSKAFIKPLIKQLQRIGKNIFPK